MPWPLNRRLAAALPPSDDTGQRRRR